MLLHNARDKIKKIVSIVALFGIASCTLCVLNLVFPLASEVSYSTTITAEDGTIAYAFLSADDKWRMKASLPEISIPLKKIIISKEDQYFYNHFGINPIAIVRAVISNIFYQKKTSGASTITMQVARLLAPKKRSYANKVIEILRAFQLEWYFTKDEILQLYLNLVPYGGNIEGVKSASVLYFGKRPDYLSLAQAVVLSIVPNKPTTWALRNNNQQLLKARNKWLMRLREIHLFTDTEIADALSEPLVMQRKPSPKEIPHLARRLKNKYPNQSNISTTILLAKQKNIEQIIHTYSRRIAPLHIFNAAVMVIDNHTHQVVCYAGSQNFWDTKHSGQIDGVQAMRSPGSTLKPFVYGLSFDKGLSTPKTIITDVPTDFDGYAPENFDKKFNGAVTVETALAYSLNIPAVKTLLEVGKNDFLEILKKTNFKGIKNRQHQLGLSLILGGCSVSLEELSNLYSSLANQGTYATLQYITADSSDNHRLQVLSPAAAYMITNILTQTTRPDLPHSAESNTHMPKIAWKTGTSYGRKDAWSIGYNSRYTVGVWLGNFDGQGVPELTGADIATPLLFSIFNHIDYNSSAQSIALPPTLGVRFVCKETGNVAEEWCEKPILDFYIPRISSPTKCTHQQWKWVTPDETLSYCSHCLPTGGYQKKLYPNLPPELISFYEQQHTPYLKTPPHNPRCSSISANSVIKIVSPLDGKKIFIDQGDDTELMLKCNAKSDINKVYWYVNDRFLKAAKPSEAVFFKPTAGAIKISCSDDKGNATNINIYVNYQ